MSAIFVLTLNTLVSLYYIYKRDSIILAYFIFFQYITLISFGNLDLFELNFVYYPLLFCLYALRAPKIYFTRSKLKYVLKNPIVISIYLILFMFFIHYQILGINSVNDRGFKTVYEFLLFTVPVIFVCVIWISNENDLDKLMKGILVYGLIFLITVIFVAKIQNIVHVRRGSVRSDFGINPIALSKMVANIFLVSLIMLEYQKKNLNKIWNLFIMALCTFIMLISASRGPIIFLILSVAIYYIIQSVKSLKKVLYIIFFSVFLLVIYQVITGYDLAIYQRFQHLQNYEESLRFIRIQKIFDLLINSPDVIIHGLGPYGFGFYSGLNYPHNYVLELFVDYGFVGFISAILLISFGAYYSIKLIYYNVSSATKCISIIWIYVFLGKMTSGDITDARYFHYISIILMISVFIVYKDKLIYFRKKIVWQNNSVNIKISSRKKNHEKEPKFYSKRTKK